MKKILSWGTCFFLLSGIAISANAGDSPIVLFAEGLNCPCKAEVVAPPPPPPSNPVSYYGGLELFGLSKSLLEGGDNVTSIGDEGGGPFATGETLRNIDDATEKFDFGGARLTIGRMLNQRDSIELAIMGFRHNADTFIVDNTGSEDIDAVWEQGPQSFLPAAYNAEFSATDSQHIETDTRLISAEINFRRKLSQMFAVFAGLRYAHLGDNLLFSTEGSPGSNFGTLDIDGDNNLIGPQIGVDALFPILEKLDIAAGLKAGVFLNSSSIDTRIADDDGNSIQWDDTDIRGSTILDGNLAMNWNIQQNVNISLGYMMALFSWVTTAGENFPQANTIEEFQQHASDHLLVHGPMARLNVLFP